MKTIEQIREECIELDLANVNSGDKSIGAYKKGRTPITFTCEKDIRLFYWNISVKQLLEYYSNYFGLEDYKAEEPKDYKQSYSIDILSILEEL